MRRSAIAAMGLLVVSLAALTGCAASERDAADAPSRPPPPYEQVAERYNQRAARLGRLWARAVVELRYPDKSGKRRWEQGDGHLQRLAPGRFSLSINKLGERIALVGCDEERFWFFEFGENSVAHIGRNSNIGAPCADPSGLPASPPDIVDMLGVLPMPTGDDALRANASVEWTPGGENIRVEFDVRSGRMRIEYPPSGLGPSRIALLARPDPAAPAREIVVARLDSYEPVTIIGEGAVRPRIAARVLITDFVGGSDVRLFLSDMTSGTPQQLPAEAFDLDFLLDSFTPRRLDVLDRRCPEPALGGRTTKPAGE